MGYLETKKAKLESLNRLVSAFNLRDQFGQPARWSDHKPVTMIDDNPNTSIVYDLALDLTGKKEELFCEAFKNATGIGIISQGVLAVSADSQPARHLFITWPLFDQLTETDISNVRKQLISTGITPDPTIN